MNAETVLLSVQRSPDARTAQGRTDVFAKKDMQPYGETASNTAKVRREIIFTEN